MVEYDDDQDKQDEPKKNNRKSKHKNDLDVYQDEIIPVEVMTPFLIECDIEDLEKIAFVIKEQSTFDLDEFSAEYTPSITLFKPTTLSVKLSSIKSLMFHKKPHTYQIEFTDGKIFVGSSPIIFEKFNNYYKGGYFGNRLSVN
jgi:hypothetical protein